MADVRPPLVALDLSLTATGCAGVPSVDERDEKPQAARARGLQPVCGALLHRSIDMEGVWFEQRCVGLAHGHDERHLPGEWVEAPEPEIF